MIIYLSGEKIKMYTIVLIISWTFKAFNQYRSIEGKFIIIFSMKTF